MLSRGRGGEIVEGVNCRAGGGREKGGEVKVKLLSGGVWVQSCRAGEVREENHQAVGGNKKIVKCRGLQTWAGGGRDEQSWGVYIVQQGLGL